MKKIKCNENKMNFFVKLRLFVNITPLRHIKFKKIHFDPSNKSIMANKLPSTNLEHFL